MMSRIFTIFIIVMLALALTSCVDPITFEAEDKEPKLVIFGTFTQLSQDHEVTISLTGKFGDPGIPVRGAYVELIDEEGNTAKYVEFQEGQYILPEGAMCGELGKAYKLTVTLQNERRYESTWEIMPEPVEIEDTYFEVNKRQRVSSVDILIEQAFVDIFVDTPLRTPGGNKAFLRWEVEEAYIISDLICGPLDNATVCYFKVNNEFEQLRIFTGIDNSQEKLEKYLVHSRLPTPHIEFSERHYFNVFQYSLPESTYEYWDKINVVTNQSGSIFDKVPAGVSGNFNEVDGNSEVLGYFEVANVNVRRFFTTPLKLSKGIIIIEVCNLHIPYPFLPDFCCICGLYTGNRIPKPDYWGE